MTTLNLPKKCFISHSYADTAARDRLLATLPSSVQAHVFPPITVDPTEFVSNSLIESLLDCDGLIYLSGGRSENSFWVAFERDYALRIGKQVFSADPKTLEISPYSGGALDLAAFASYHRADRTRVSEIAEFLERERYFDLFVDYQDLEAGSLWTKQLEESLADRLKRGGYLIVFWSHQASTSEFIKSEIEQASKEISGLNDRVLFALLDNMPVPEFWLQFQDPSVQLYGDEERSLTQRMDDLVVRLCWLIYRKTRHSKLDKPGDSK